MQIADAEGKFRERVEQERARLSWTVRNLSDRANVDEARLYRILRRDQAPTLQQAWAIADALEVSLASLLPEVPGSGLTDAERAVLNAMRQRDAVRLHEELHQQRLYHPAVKRQAVAKWIQGSGYFGEAGEEVQATLIDVADGMRSVVQAQAELVRTIERHLEQLPEGPVDLPNPID